jgi:hypothetical protein
MNGRFIFRAISDTEPVEDRPPAPERPPSTLLPHGRALIRLGSVTAGSQPNGPRVHLALRAVGAAERNRPSLRFLVVAAGLEFGSRPEVETRKQETGRQHPSRCVG